MEKLREKKEKLLEEMKMFSLKPRRKKNKIMKFLGFSKIGEENLWKIFHLKNFFFLEEIFLKLFHLQFWNQAKIASFRFFSAGY